MAVTSLRGDMPCGVNGNSEELLSELCAQLNVPRPNAGFSVQLMSELIAVLASTRIPTNNPPLELIRDMLRILSEEIVRAPLDHLDATELLHGQPEAVQDLLEILAACVNLRDVGNTVASVPSSNSTSSSATVTHFTAGDDQISDILAQSSSLSSLSSPAAYCSNPLGNHRQNNSPFGSSLSCSSCDSVSSESSSYTSSLSEPTQDIQLPCRLCQYLAQFPSESNQTTATGPNNTKANSTIITVDRLTKPDNVRISQTTLRVTSAHATASDPKLGGPNVKARATDPKSNAGVRPSKSLRSNCAGSRYGHKTRMEQRLQLRETANSNKRELDKEMESTEINKPREKTVKVYRGNVIFGQASALKPVPLPPPESAFSRVTCNSQTGSIDDLDNGSVSVDCASVSPHLARVLKKQYSQHLQWMASHGTSETGLRKLEKEYEDLLGRHAARSKQVRKEICEQARLSARNTQKGVAASTRNLRTYARTQEQKLAHAQLEIDRIARSREARQRLCEERILRETFMEAMQLQKNQLLDLNRELAEKRGRERDRHRIYMQGMEHFYRTQLDMLHEAVEREARDGQIRTGAQIALLRDMRKELRAKLDEEMKALREIANMDFDKTFDDTA